MKQSLVDFAKQYFNISPFQLEILKLYEEKKSLILFYPMKHGQTYMQKIIKEYNDNQRP